MFQEREKPTPAARLAITEQQFQQIQQLAETIRYGSINLIFQDGVLIQIEKSEKIRIPKTQN